MNETPPLDPRRRLREVLSIPERDRTDEQWDEIIEIEITLAPRNRESGPAFGQTARSATGAAQAETDSLRRLVRTLPFYRDLLYNDSTGTSLMMVFVNPERFNSEQRGDMVEQIDARVREFESGGSRCGAAGCPTSAPSSPGSPRLSCACSRA